MSTKTPDPRTKAARTALPLLTPATALQGLAASEDARALGVLMRRWSDSTFVDVETGERYDDGCDPHGVDLAGSDEDEDGERYCWWGTDRVAWVLSRHWATVRVYGRLGGHGTGSIRWSGHFVGTVSEAVIYAECHGVTVEETEDGADGLTELYGR